MINAWEYAYDNYDGENEDSVVDSIVEQLSDEILDACDVNDGIDEYLYDGLTGAIREVVVDSINFKEIKKQMEDDRDEYFERRKSSLGEY